MQTDRLWPSGPSPSVLSKRSFGPVAFIRKAYFTLALAPSLLLAVGSTVTYGVGSAASPSDGSPGRRRERTRSRARLGCLNAEATGPRLYRATPMGIACGDGARAVGRTLPG